MFPAHSQPTCSEDEVMNESLACNGETYAAYGELVGGDLRDDCGLLLLLHHLDLLGDRHGLHGLHGLDSLDGLRGLGDGHSVGVLADGQSQQGEEERDDEEVLHDDDDDERSGRRMGGVGLNARTIRPRWFKCMM